MKLGLFGFPVAHSKSPLIFAQVARQLKRKISYEAVPVPPDSLAEAVARARTQGWRGANVTVPLKEESARLADALTPAARALGAANVLRFGRNIAGHNTDADGLRDALARARFSARGEKALIFGAGGAARAAGWALARGGAQAVRFFARTPARARRAARVLAPHFPGTKFSAGAPLAAGFWVNATPLGLKGFPDRSPAPKSAPSPRWAVDLVYGRRTAFQRDAAARGAQVMDGCAMLVFQALRAWEFWDRPLGARRRALMAERLLQEVFT